MKNVKKAVLFIFIFIFIICFQNAVEASEIITSNYYIILQKNEDIYIKGIIPNTTINEISSDLDCDSTNIKAYYADGSSARKESIAKTGMRLEIENKNYNLIVCGDINGDGKITQTDLIKLKLQIVKKEQQSGAYFEACDVDSNGIVGTTDLLKTKRILTKLIQQEEIYEEVKEDEDFIYSINKLTNVITIEKYKGTAREVIVPNIIENKPVTKIKFEGNENIQSIKFSTNVRNITATAFKQCSNLKEIIVDTNNLKYSSKEGILFNKGEKKLICYPQAREAEIYEINDNVEEITEGAFYKTKNLKKLIVPSTVTNIQSNVFYQWSGKVIGKNNTVAINYAKTNGIAYETDKAPVIEKAEPINNTGKETSILIEATDDYGIVGWQLTQEDKEPTNWRSINKLVEIQLTEIGITANGNYYIWVKDTLGEVSKKIVNVSGIDTIAPEVQSIAVISPTSGEYFEGQAITIRVAFNENIVGTPPVLSVIVGQSNGIGSMSNTIPNGTTNYIDYTYIAGSENGELKIANLTGGSITDLAGNAANITVKANTGNTITLSNEELKVHYLNVPRRWENGEIRDYQGDAIVITSGNEAMLLDGGYEGYLDDDDKEIRGTEETIINYLQSQGITHLKYVIATHEHNDHVGGLEEFISEHTSISVGEFYSSPYFRSNSSATFYIGLALAKRNIPNKTINVGDVLTLGKTKIECLGPLTEYNHSSDKENQNSLILKFTLGNTSYLSCGDADGSETNQELANRWGSKLKCSVLHLAHHGGGPNNSAFMQNASPQIQVASSGWLESSTNVYSTLNGEFTIILDGNNVRVER